MPVKKKAPKPPAPRTVHDSSLFEDLTPKPDNTPTIWGHFQAFAVKHWEANHGKGGPKKVKYIAPVISSPVNQWKFHGYVSMPPKPIHNTHNYPLFYLAISHSAKRQIEGDYLRDTRVTTTRPVILVCKMIGALAVKWGFLRVGTEVVARGRFSVKRTRFGDRTEPMLEELYVVGGGEGESGMGDEDRETLRVLMELGG